MTYANDGQQPHTHDIQHIHDFNGVCPICGGAMVVTRINCGQCGSALEGAFRLTGEGTTATAPSAAHAAPTAHAQGQAAAATATQVAQASEIATRFGRLARLDPTQLEFVEVFLQSRGVIKNVEDVLGISYPTVKARLASVLDAMGFGADDEPPTGDERQWRRQILADLRDGRITAEEAHRRLAAAAPTGADDAGADRDSV